jgi:SAM-dependent methyltransferase
MNEWSTSAHAGAYLSRPDVNHRGEGEAVLYDLLPPAVRRILDLGTGDGRLLARVRAQRPDASGVAVDFSPTMLAAAGARFADDVDVEVVEHDLDQALPRSLGRFDVVVSGFAIHHCADERKRSLYREVFDLLEPGGLFANLEHVASPTERLHLDFYAGIEADEDPSNHLASVWDQMQWLRDIGFEDVDCFWKWRELALLAGTKPV